MAGKKAATKEEVFAAAVSLIRSKFGDGAIMRLGDNQLPQVEVIPTGILPLDIALGVGGVPKGRIVEIYGPEGGGKTTISLHILAEAQRNGGIAAFIDAEHALDPNLAAALGVDVANLYLSQPDSGEQAFFIIDSLVKSGAVDLIVVDSVAALLPQAEIDGKQWEGGAMPVGLHARLMSYALRRLTASIAKSRSTVIFINQLRSTISTGYASGPTETTTGGRALKFYSSVRMEVKRGKSISEKDVVIGHELNIKVTKNKLAPPFRTAHASLIYGKGVPKTTAIVDMALDHEIIKRRGSWMTYKGETLEQGKEKVAKYLEEHPDLMEEVKNAVLVKAASGYVAPVKATNTEAEQANEESIEALLDEGLIKLDLGDEGLELDDKNNPDEF